MHVGLLHWIPKHGKEARGGTQYKSGYRDVPQTWVAKSGRQVHQWVPFFSKTWYFDGSIFQNFLKFAPKWRKFGTLIGQLFKISEICAKMAQISAKNFDFWYMDGSLFLQNGYMDGWHFKNPSGTPLPRPKLSTPPGEGGDLESLTWPIIDVLK